jgi:L-2,4-diaminobutyrate decarboxylase
MGMSAVAMERILIGCLASVFGFQPEACPNLDNATKHPTASGFFTSGGSLANLTALLAARARLPADETRDPTKLAIMVSAQAHYCAAKAATIMGLPSENILLVPTNERYEIDTTTLSTIQSEAAREGKTVIAVVGSSCTTSTGSFDNLIELSRFARQHNIWMHIDGAHGAAVAFSAKHRHLLDGIQWADSVTIDFHKLLMTPALCSALVFRDREASFRSFATEAEYLFAKSSNSFDESSPARRTFECTKNMMVAKVFAIYQQFGTKAWEANVDHLHALTRQFQDVLLQEPGFEVACDPQTNIICYRFRRNPMSSMNHCEQMQEIRSQIVAAGRFYIVSTKLGGETWLRSTVSNPFTTIQHFRELCEAVKQASSQLC